MATGEMITFDAAGKERKGYLARPEGDPNGRAVVVVQDWWGLNENTKDIARRYADEGFVAFAPDLDDGVVTKDAGEASRLMRDLDPDHGIAILDGALDHLATLDGVDRSRIGVTGFCMGGSFALLLACRNRAIQAAAPFYGDIPSDEDLAKLTAPILFIGGAKDDWITVEKMEKLRSSLERLDKTGEVKIYEQAGHAFFNDTRPEAYDAEAAADAWRRVLAFFDETL